MPAPGTDDEQMLTGRRPHQPADRMLANHRAVHGDVGVLLLPASKCLRQPHLRAFWGGLRGRGGFGRRGTMEVLPRGWTLRGRSMRPDHRMVAHTGFLTFARRLAGLEVFETENF